MQVWCNENGATNRCGLINVVVMRQLPQYVPLIDWFDAHRLFHYLATSAASRIDRGVCK